MSVLSASSGVADWVGIEHNIRSLGVFRVELNDVPFTDLGFGTDSVGKGGGDLVIHAEVWNEVSSWVWLWLFKGLGVEFLSNSFLGLG